MMNINDGYCSLVPSTSHLLIHSTWARTILSKIDNDRCLQSLDRTQWYRLSRSDLIDEQYRKRFQQFNEDEETTTFIKQSQKKSDMIPLQIIYSLLTSLFTVFITKTSANGLLGRGQMFVYSTRQFQTLLDLSPANPSPFTTLLDIGAGDGSVTKRMSSLFEKVYVTELSPTMQWRLSQYGYTVLDVDQWGDNKFDVITCLNVLDRCEKPFTLLKQIRDHLNPSHGRLIISLVLPFRPYFEYSSTHHPDEFLPITGQHPEEQINDLITHLFQPLGFHLRKFTRLPYLCEGDLARSYYILFDYLFVLEMSEVSTQ